VRVASVWPATAAVADVKPAVRFESGEVPVHGRLRAAELDERRDRREAVRPVRVRPGREQQREALAANGHISVADRLLPNDDERSSLLSHGSRRLGEQRSESPPRRRLLVSHPALADPECVRDLLLRQVFDLAEQEDRPLLLRKTTQRYLDGDPVDHAGGVILVRSARELRPLAVVLAVVALGRGLKLGRSDLVARDPLHAPKLGEHAHLDERTRERVERDSAQRVILAERVEQRL